MALFEETDVLCVADREGGRVECINAGLQKPLHANRDDTGKRVVNYNQKVIGRPYAIASKGKLPTLRVRNKHTPTFMDYFLELFPGAMVLLQT